MTILAAAVLALLWLSVTVTASTSDIWDEGLTGEIRWGENLTIGEYSLKLADFSLEDSSVPRVHLQAFMGHNYISSCILGKGESSTINDSLRATVEEISGSRTGDAEPRARVRVQLKAVPEISLVLATDKDVYKGGEMISLDLEARNTGVVDADDIKIVLDCDPPIFRSSYSRSVLEPGAVWRQNMSSNKSDHIRIDISAPYLAQQTEVRVRAVARYEGQDGMALKSFGGAVFWISGPLKLHKMAEVCTDRDMCYLVTDVLENCGNRTLDVDLDDGPGPDFKASSGLSKKLRLSPGETEAASCILKPLKPGNFSLPSAEARYQSGGRTYLIRSEKPDIEVDGPFIDVERTASSQSVMKGDIVRITLNICNKGNRKAMVYLREPLPKGAKLVTPGIDFKALILPGQNRSHQYSIQCLSSDDIDVKETEVIYKDVEGHEYIAQSPSLRIRVEVPKPKNMTPTISSSEDADDPARDKSEASGRSYPAYAALSIVLVFALAIRKYI
jgi:hypothetical protein